MTPEERLILLIKLDSLGITKIEITYSGSGDSGQIEDYIAYNGNIVLDECPEKEDLDSLFYDHSEALENWYDDDGGYGTMTIDIKEQSIHFDNNIYYKETVEYGHDYELITNL